ncbi:translation initiation factor IF-2-like [Camelus ferus]|uniref:Translation initiation factor IF-2-like n=1 Tax=Camelus ferus TaxID=419612 RepID=A0A8B8TNU2_CAMFR|nr:translation initiation factor IF-2-like [Camelus ferus]XP_032343933.1 translation initiation factor IF-2-like [Camelus ferus]XP_032343934.1 translation initiation factor IF-2-like [Camelus ferus]
MREEGLTQGNSATCKRTPRPPPPRRPAIRRRGARPPKVKPRKRRVGGGGGGVRHQPADVRRRPSGMSGGGGAEAGLGLAEAPVGGWVQTKGTAGRRWAQWARTKDSRAATRRGASCRVAGRPVAASRPASALPARSQSASPRIPAASAAVRAWRRGTCC